MLAATYLLLPLLGVIASKNGFPDTPSKAALLSDLLSCFFEIIHNRPADCGILLSFCGLLLVLRKLFRMLACECRIELFAVGFFFYEFWAEGRVHWVAVLVRVCGIQGQMSYL